MIFEIVLQLSSFGYHWFLTSSLYLSLAAQLLAKWNFCKPCLRKCVQSSKFCTTFFQFFYSFRRDKYRYTYKSYTPVLIVSKGLYEGYPISTISYSPDLHSCVASKFATLNTAKSRLWWQNSIFSGINIYWAALVHVTYTNRCQCKWDNFLRAQVAAVENLIQRFYLFYFFISGIFIAKVIYFTSKVFLLSS